MDGSSKGFRVVGLQINNIFILANNIFAVAKEQELKKAKLLAKNRKKLTYDTFIKFNGGYIRLIVDNSLFLSKKKQCPYLRLIAVKEPVDLMSSHGKIKKAVIPKD